MNFLKKTFNFLSSIKLAVPIMLLLLGASVAGTLYESNFNAEYAGLKIYKTWWFLVILGFLWINILFAALSRIPWKKRHTGFLITHLGMLILLFGSVLTMVWGIDGTMQIYEKSESNLVFLQNNVLEVNGVKTEIKRHLEKADLSSLSASGRLPFSISTFLPFVDVPEKVFSNGTNVNFKIKSAFFDVVQTLNTVEQKEVQMGPAVFRLVENNVIEKVATPEVKAATSKVKKNKGENLLIVNDVTGNQIKSIEFNKVKNFKIGAVEFKIVNVFKNAQIANNKIEEGDTSRVNPAMEVIAMKGTEKIREIIYQNMPEFSLNPNGLFGYKLAFNSSLTNSNESQGGNVNSVEMPANHPQVGNSSGSDSRMKNTVEFKIIDENTVEVALFKSGEQLLKKIVKQQEMIVTPWMGIELTFLGAKPATSEFIPTITEPKRKMPLPPSAILLKTNEGKETWITENSEMNIMSNNISTPVYYGRERLILPFALSLVKFEKNDYPGSEMAMNYKSYVQVNGQGPVQEIYMNEPLKLEGYTFYQSSYQITPNAPAITILSVNRDPGRELKYIGSIILCLGIMIYTLQKSKRFQAKFNL